ncbi:MAG: hypothetical protein KGJ13_07200 [Patescibacteria group bacterium]|nr:hypothetical protein [Patescibacteria group bacterium]
MTVDPDERTATLAAARANYINGEFGPVRLQAILVMCGLNATEIKDFMDEHREAAYKAMLERNAKGPYRI